MASNSIISYTEGGSRVWIEINGSGVVINKGSCTSTICTISITFYNIGNSSFEIQSNSDFRLESDINVVLRVVGDITANTQDIPFTIPTGSVSYSTNGSLIGFSGQDLINSTIFDYTPTGDSSFIYVIQYIV